MFKKIIKIIALLIVIFFGSAVLLLSTRIGGIRAFVVKSASMQPTIITGSLVITQKVLPDTLQPNDIVTFIRPDKSREFVTHRIIEIYDNKGTKVLKTKGDNNNNADSWQVAGGGVVGKVLFSIPKLGYLLSLARTKVGIMLLILVPAILVIIDEIRKIIVLIKTAKKERLGKKTIELTILIFAIFGISNIFFTNTLMNDSVSVVDNSFTVLITPTPSPTPSPCDDDGTCIVIIGNGSNTNTTIDVEDIDIETVIQLNDTNLENEIEASSSTGNNIVSSNIDSNVTITTGDAESITTIVNMGDINY